jgi:hypothetical protein
MKLETFDFNSMPVRVMDRDGQPWFVAADVCRVLELSNPSMACEGLDEDEKMTLSNTEGHSGQRGGARQIGIISESGLYALIFKSRKAEARKFRRWVTSEVLPAIRRTGGYALPMGGGEVMGPEIVSVLSFVREACADWPLDRQMEFGLLVRRYAKSMGVVFQTVEEPGVGRVFAFGRPVLEAVRATLTPAQAVLCDAEAHEMAALLRTLHDRHGDTSLAAEEVRREAARMGLFPRVMNLTGEAARSSRFGMLVARHAGRVFPGGYVIENFRTRRGGLYTIRREAGAVAAAAPA